MEKNKDINKEWEVYYKDLEAIRASGICNMFEGDRYLKALHSELTEEKAVEILLNWMHNYDALNKKYGWRKNEK